MHHPYSTRNNQRTNSHPEALSSKKTGLPASCPEMIRKKAFTEDINKTRARPRRPDMQLYVPRARRSQVTPGASFSVDVHSLERIDNSQIDNKCSEVSFGMISNCSSSISNVRQKKSNESDHLLQSNFQHQEDQSETENTNKDDNHGFNRYCNIAKSEKLPESQILETCAPKSILYRKTPVEDRNNILNVQRDDQNQILNQKSSILSRKTDADNLSENVPDFDVAEQANQKEMSEVTNNSYSSVHISDNEVKADICKSTDNLDNALVEIKLDGLSDNNDLCLVKGYSSGKSNAQVELIETKGLNSGILSEVTEQLQAICKADALEEKEFVSEQKESTLPSEDKCSAETDTTIFTQCEYCLPEFGTKTTIQSEGKIEDVKFSECLSVPVLEASKEIDLSLESVETGSDVSSSNAVDTSSKSANDDSWDSMFDDDGECLNPEILKELTAAVGSVKITKSKYNYLEFQPHEPDVSGEEFGHIVEFYDFPVEFKNQDILTIISAFKNEAFNIKWVDDTHALGVFSSPLAAMDALNLNHPLLKVRPLSKGIRESKFKAKRCAEFLQPYRPRPETSATIARRLVSGALGVRVQIPKEQRELERKRLKEARDRRRQAVKQKQDIWDGVVS